MVNGHEELVGGYQPLKSSTPLFGIQVTTYHPYQPCSLKFQFLLVKADCFPRDKIQITETSDQPLSAHTKLLLLIQNGMLQILYSMNIYSLQKWLPNH